MKSNQLSGGMSTPVLKPVVSSPDPVKKPVVQKNTAEKRWVFSFRFWRQIQNFGLDSDKIDNAWLVAVMNRLHDLSHLKIDHVLKDESTRDFLRYHNINWNQKNIPVQRADLDWIDAVYLNNPDEYPLVQFMVSTAMGRVIGFWDEDNVFQVVLLDPLHNMQPSKNFNYRVDPCSPLSCDYSLLVDAVDRAIDRCGSGACATVEGLRKALRQKRDLAPFDVVLMKLSNPEHIEDARVLMNDGVAASYAEIFEAGIYALIESSGKKAP